MSKELGHIPDHRDSQPEPREIIDRTAHGDLLLQTAFGSILDLITVSKIADIGAGDSTLFAARAQHGQSVTRIDQDYHYDRPDGTNWHAYDARHLPIDDASYDAVISSFMLQHLSGADQKRAISEMLRITKPGDNERGFVGLFPAYGGEKLRQLVADLDLVGTVAIEDLITKKTGNIATDKLLKYPTLWISNRTDKQAELDQLIDIAVDKNVFNKRQTIREKIGQRAFSAAAKESGSNRRPTPS